MTVLIRCLFLNKRLYPEIKPDGGVVYLSRTPDDAVRAYKSTHGIGRGVDVMVRPLAAFDAEVNIENWRRILAGGTVKISITPGLASVILGTENL